MSEALFQVPSRKAVDDAIGRLAVAFQRQIDAATVKVYRDTLSDLPLWAIEGAELQLRRKGGTFFPTAPEWHRAAEVLIQDQTRQVLARRPDNASLFECDTCRDTGWCDEERDGRSVCIPCSCRSTNSNYQRMTKSSRKSLNEEVKH